MRFRLIFRGSRLQVEMTQDATTFTLLDGSPLTLVSDDSSFTVSADEPVVMPVVVEAEAAAG